MTCNVMGVVCAHKPYFCRYSHVLSVYSDMYTVKTEVLW